MNLVTDYAERGPEKSVEIIPGRQKGQDRTQVHGRQAGSVQMIKKAINESTKEQASRHIRWDSMGGQQVGGCPISIYHGSVRRSPSSGSWHRQNARLKCRLVKRRRGRTSMKECNNPASPPHFRVACDLINWVTSQPVVW